MRFSIKNNFFLLFFLCCFTINAQKHHCKNYTAADDLPNNTVRSLLINKKGNLWIGTDNGLVLKENNVFTSYFEEDGLSQNNIWALAEDPNQQLWIGSFGGGVSIFDGTQFKNIKKEKGLVHNNVIKLFQFKNYMCVGTYDGLSLIDINSHQILSIKPKTIKPFKVSGFFTYKNELYCTTVWTGLFKVVIEKGKIKLLTTNKNQNSTAIFIDGKSIYSSNTGFYIKTNLDSFIKDDRSFYPKNGHSILWEYVKDHQNRIFAAAGGLYTNDGGIYEIVNNQLISKSDDFGINSKNALSIAFDSKFNKLYVGTADKGLFEVNLNETIKFNNIPNNSVLGFSQNGNTNALLVKDALILTNFNNEKRISLNQFKDWQKKYVSTTKKPLPKHSDFFYEIEYNTKPEEIKFYDIKSFQNKFWINTTIGLFVINTSGKLHQYVPVHTEEFNFTFDGKLVETNPYHGLRIYNKLEDFTYNYFPEEDPNTPTMVVNSLKKNDKTYFLSVFSGLYVWDKNQFKSYVKNNRWEVEKLRHISTFENNLAISTEFGDVYIVNDEKEFRLINKIERSQIQGNTISFLNEYNGNLLIGTEKGLTIYKNNRFIFVNHEQGLSQPFLSSQTKGNLLFIGSENGYYSINLDNLIEEKPLVSHLKLTQININNKPENLDKINADKSLNLPYFKNSLAFYFTTNSHPYPNKLVYQYRLGKKEEWSNFSSKPEIILPYLPTKNYEVEVTVLDQSTGLTYTETLLQLKINPPFWKTWWFILMVLAIVGFILYGIYRFQMAQHKAFEEQKRKIQKRVEETKMEALLAQMNPHFIFNAMNSIQGYIMDSDIPNATYFLSEFSSLIRKNLDHCTKPTILLIEEIEYLQSFIRLENIRFNNKVNVQYNVDPKLNLYDIEIPSMLLQPFVENVFVHAFPPSIKEPKLTLEFKLLDENTLQCIIEDNGIGIVTTHNKLHQSKGISLIKERLVLLGYDIDKSLHITSSRGVGTKVSISLKINP